MASDTLTRVIHIAGDGVAGLSLAARLLAEGVTPVVHGDGRARAGAYALVHRYAGRSFRSSPLEDAAWSSARPWLESLVDVGAAWVMRMVRPVGSAAGSRLEGSLGHADDVAREVVEPFGESFVYGPAFVVDVDAALEVLSRGVEYVEGRTERADAVWAVGSAAQLPRIEGYGGQVVQFDGALDVAVSGGGIHAVPAAGGICVGATFWPLAAPMHDEPAVAELRARGEALGLTLGEARRVWSGVRAVNGLDRVPLVGELDGRFVVAGLGTRGWYWAALLADQAAMALVHGEPVRAELRADRVTDRT